MVADGCGIGKSLQAIAALYLIWLKSKMKNAQVCKVAIVTRTSLEPQMMDELIEFCNSAKEKTGVIDVCTSWKVIPLTYFFRSLNMIFLQWTK